MANVILRSHLGVVIHRFGSRGIAATRTQKYARDGLMRECGGSAMRQ
jgi:hypothetical protein